MEFARCTHSFWFKDGFDAVDCEDAFEASNSAMVRDLVEILVIGNRLPLFGSFCVGGSLMGTFYDLALIVCGMIDVLFSTPFPQIVRPISREDP